MPAKSWDSTTPTSRHREESILAVATAVARRFRGPPRTITDGPTRRRGSPGRPSPTRATSIRCARSPPRFSISTAACSQRAARAGTCRLRDAPAGVLAYERVLGEDRRTIVVNFTEEPRPCAIARGTIEVASDGGGEGAACTGVLAPESAVLLRPVP
jgi:hypothetical protein